MIDDLYIIYPEYSKYWNFWEDFSKLNVIEFYSRINSLGGKFEELINLRYRYLNGKKMDYNERIVAHKPLTDNQIKKLEYRKKQSQAKKGIGLIKSIFEKKDDKKAKEAFKLWQQ